MSTATKFRPNYRHMKIKPEDLKPFFDPAAEGIGEPQTRWKSYKSEIVECPMCKHRMLRKSSKPHYKVYHKINLY